MSKSRYVISHFLLTGGIIAGSLLPYSSDPQTMDLVGGIKNIVWFVALSMGMLSVFGGFLAINEFSEAKKSPAKARSDKFIEMVFRDYGIVWPFIMASTVATVLACAYSGWWFPSFFWTLFALLSVAIHEEKKKFRTHLRGPV